MNKQQLASKIWASANKMRSKIEANEYKDYILGFIFYKFLSDKEVTYLKGIGYTEEDLDTVSEDDQEIVENVQKNVGYFIAYENLYSTWLDKGSDFDVSNVRDALQAFSRLINPSHKKVFEKIFNTLETGLSKLGDSSGSQTKAIRDLLNLIKDIPMDGRQDYDVLGFIYEYLISNFAANAGKKAGEFYTPHEVSLLMSEIVADHLSDRSEIKIFDPTSGSGSLLINIGKSVARRMGNGDRIKYYAQELKENTYNLTRMNLVMRGILPDNIVARNADTLEDDWPYFDDNDPVNTYEPLYVDAVVSNPPYSQQWDPTGKDADPRYKSYGVAPKGKADYAFLLHDLYHIKPDGIMTIVLPHGVLFRGGEEGTIRKNLIENNKIDAIIGLPANIFFGTGIPTIIMVLKQRKTNDDILIIDASKGFEKVGKNNKLRASDIKRIVDAVQCRTDIEKFAKVVSREEVRQNDYNLNIPRYVDSSEKPESWDIYASMFGGIPKHEISEFADYWISFPTLKGEIFADLNAEYLKMSSSGLKEIVNNNTDVKTFREKFLQALSDFPEFLKEKLIENYSTANASGDEALITEELFKRIQPFNLIDRYDAYQILDDKWGEISTDIEILQTEGPTALTQVDPNMIIKKKGDKEEEIQDGWVGHVIPFSIVQEVLLPNALESIKVKENRLAEVSSSMQDLFDELPEEDKESSYVNDDKTAFVPAEVKKILKKKDADAEILAILKQYDQLAGEEKELKQALKRENTELIKATKNAIEGLSSEKSFALLEKKWIDPIMHRLAAIPDDVIGKLVTSLVALSKKYETTMEDIETEIESTEASLRDMLDNLTGSEFDMKGLQEFKKLIGGSDE